MKHIKNQITKLEYNPFSHRLYFLTNALLCYNFDTFDFKIDNNPLGEPILSKIQNVKITDNNDKIELDTVFRRKERHIVLDCYNTINQYIYKLFATLQKLQFHIRKEDMDRIVIIVENDVISEIEVYKRSLETNELLDTLTINRLENSLYLEEFCPYRKSLIEKVAFDGKAILLKTEEKERMFQFDIQDLIFDCFKNILIDSCMSLNNILLTRSR